jgi:hypothetical protein
VHKTTDRKVIRVICNIAIIFNYQLLGSWITYFISQCVLRYECFTLKYYIKIPINVHRQTRIFFILNIIFIYPFITYVTVVTRYECYDIMHSGWLYYYYSNSKLVVLPVHIILTTKLPSKNKPLFFSWRSQVLSPYLLYTSWFGVWKGDVQLVQVSTYRVIWCNPYNNNRPFMSGRGSDSRSNDSALVNRA